MVPLKAVTGGKFQQTQSGGYAWFLYIHKAARGKARQPAGFRPNTVQILMGLTGNREQPYVSFLLLLSCECWELVHVPVRGLYAFSEEETAMT